MASPVPSVLAQSRKYKRAGLGGGDSDEPRKGLGSWDAGLWKVGGQRRKGGGEGSRRKLWGRRFPEA